MIRKNIFALLVLTSFSGMAWAQTYAIKNARIVTVSGPTIPNGNILVQDGKITAVGANIPIPASAKVIDAKGLSAYPGMIDAHTSMGLEEIESIPGTQDINEIGDINPHIKASAAVNPLSEHVGITRASGVTTVLSAPQGGLIGGQGTVINLNGWVLKDMLMKDSAGVIINFPRDVNLPANAADRQRRDAEDTRRKRIDLLRKTLRDAQSYSRLLDARVDAESNLALRALIPVIKGDMPAMFVANTASEIKGALEIADEFKLKAILVGASDARQVLDLIKSKNVPVLFGGTFKSPDKDSDAYDALYSTPAALSKAGIKFGFTVGGASSVHDLPFQAGMAVGFGLDKDEALKAVTLYPAQILHIDNQVGSLQEGKTANIILADGDPLELLTHVKQVFIAGKPVELKNKQTELYDTFSKRP